MEPDNMIPASPLLAVGSNAVNPRAPVLKEKDQGINISGLSFGNFIYMCVSLQSTDGPIPQPRVLSVNM